MLQTKTARIKPAKSVSRCDNSNKTGEFAALRSKVAQRCVLFRSNNDNRQTAAVSKMTKSLWDDYILPAALQLYRSRYSLLGVRHSQKHSINGPNASEMMQTLEHIAVC